MLETIMNKKYEMLNFQPFIEYVKKLEQENFVLLSDKEEYSFRANWLLDLPTYLQYVNPFRI